MKKEIRNHKSFLKIINNNKYKKIFILSGYNSLIKSGADKILINDINKDKKVKFFFKKKSFPETKELLKIMKSFKKFSPNLILAIGGGAVLDYAKIINIVSSTKNIVNKIQNYNYNSTKKNTKLIAIPTTAGSGAEVTSNAVIYHNKIKYSFEDKLLIPDNFYLCPKTLINVPTKIKASSGFDAIAQSIESMFSKKSSKKSFNFAKKSLKISIEYYLKYLKKPNLYNSTKMATAANLAGSAINISKTTAPHASSYPFSALYNINHGHAVSLNFERFIEFTYLNIHRSNNPSELKNIFNFIFKITKTKNIREFVNFIKFIKRESDLIDNYKYLKININKDLNKILEGVNPLRLKNNPIELSRQNLEKIILQTF